jgi:hypothetical protein
VQSIRGELHQPYSKVQRPCSALQVALCVLCHPTCLTRDVGRASTEQCPCMLR